MYRERMTNYYPEVIKRLLEFQGIIDGEYPEFELLGEQSDRILNDAYLLTMTEDRIIEWEKALEIAVNEGDTLQDRREVIIARIRGQGKLNTALINSIVNAFTNGTAESWFEDSVIHVNIKPPPGNKQFKFDNVERELEKKKPAHLGLSVKRDYATWGEISDDFTDWNDVMNNFANWEEVAGYVSP
jgi:hypothetical protein